MKIAVLGASGMLGSMLVGYLSKHFPVVATVRSADKCQLVPGVEYRLLNIGGSPAQLKLVNILNDCDWVINAIGCIPQRNQKLHEQYRLNSRFPRQLANVACSTGCRVIQIATDCVFSGARGRYTERDEPDPFDVYGKSKMLGEIESDNVFNLRCSLIGLEPYGNYSLLRWFLSQPVGVTIEGYAGHLWNGITTLAFARICRGVIENDYQMPSLQHIVPFNSASKSVLLEYFREEFDRQDITINHVCRGLCDRRLETVTPHINDALWQMAGYKEVPSIRTLVKELAEYTE